MTERPTGEELLPTREAARLIDVSVRSLYRYEQRGLITSIGVPGGHRRWRRAEVLGLLQPRHVA